MPMRKIRKPRYLGAAVIALASAVAVALVPGAAAAQVTPVHSNYRVSVTLQDVAPCTDEIIEMNITFSVIFTGFEQPSGQFKYTQHMLTTGEGEGSLGNHYRLSWTQLINDMFAPGGPEIYTDLTDMHVVGEGDAPDFLLRARERMTVSASGERSVYFENFSAECR